MSRSTLKPTKGPISYGQQTSSGTILGLPLICQKPQQEVDTAVAGEDTVVAGEDTVAAVTEAVVMEADMEVDMVAATEEVMVVAMEEATVVVATEITVAAEAVVSVEVVGDEVVAGVEAENASNLSKTGPASLEILVVSRTQCNLVNTH